MGFFSKGLNDEFEIAMMVNEPSMFKPLKFYCIYRPCFIFGYTTIFCYPTRKVLEHLDVSVETILWKAMAALISIFHGCMVWIEKSVTRVTDRHHDACQVMPNSDPE